MTGAGPPTRTVALHSGALGDVILFGHLLYLLDEPVTLVAGGQRARLLVEAGVVAKAVDFDVLPMHEVFSDVPLDKCALPGLLGGHDRLVSCFGAGDASAQLRLAAICGAKNAAFLPVRPAANCAVHLVKLWTDMLGLAGGNGPSPAPWNAAASWRQAAADALAGLDVEAGTGAVVIHPGAGAEQKCWPLENFLHAADQLAASGKTPVFVVGPVETDRWPADRIDSIRRRFPLLEYPSLRALAGIFAASEAAICNDSGAAHLAGAVGARTVALFGSSSAIHFAPLGPQVKVIAARTMQEISVGQVLAAAGCGASPGTD